MKVGLVVLLSCWVPCHSGWAQVNDAGDGPSFALRTYEVTELNGHSDSVAIGDANDDGRLDVLISTSVFDLAPLPNDGSLIVFHQNAAAGLEPPVVRPHHHIWARLPVVVADLDGKNGLDVAVGGSGGVTRFLSDGKGGQGEGIIVSGVRSTALLAVNLQDDTETHDLVSAGWWNSGDLYLNDGAGSFSTMPWDVAVEGYNTIAGIHLDADGRQDVIVASAQGGVPDALLYRNTGDGNLVYAGALESRCSTTGASGVGAGDLNGDGLADVVLSSGGNQPSSCLQVFYANGQGGFSRPVVVPVLDIPTDVQVVDMNIDGRDDVVVHHTGWLAVGIHLQRNDGTLAEPVYHPLPGIQGSGPQSMAVGDFSGDGCPDIAFADNFTGLVTVEAELCSRIFQGSFDRT